MNARICIRVGRCKASTGKLTMFGMGLLWCGAGQLFELEAAEEVWI